MVNLEDKIITIDIVVTNWLRTISSTNSNSNGLETFIFWIPIIYRVIEMADNNFSDFVEISCSSIQKTSLDIEHLLCCEEAARQKRVKTMMVQCIVVDFIWVLV